MLRPMKSISALRVHFIHGLEGSPQGAKARFLQSHFDAVAPAMDTRDFAGALETQAAALYTRRPDVLVGSSFGGAIAVALLQRGLWHGPTILLAPAAAKLGLPNHVPPDRLVIIVHGTRDDVVPLADSRALAATGTPGLVRLLEIADDHRLQGILDTGLLRELVIEAAARADQ